MNVPARDRDPDPTAVGNVGDISREAGCSAKLSGSELHDLVHDAYENALGRPPPEGLVDAPQDAAAVELGRSRILVTTDTVPLPCPDFETAGRIAALHAMNDVFAPGGIPRFALVSLCVEDRHRGESIEASMRGIVKACDQEGVQIVGGHTIVGPRTTLGLTVLGTPSARPLSKRGAQPGDRLLLSKPLGVGVLTRGFRLGTITAREFASAVDTMSESNRAAAEVASSSSVNACTDVSGFGLLGHLGEMLQDGQGAAIEIATVPVLEGAREAAARLAPTYWTRGNEEYTAARIVNQRSKADASVLFDPQANGGLLVAVSPDSTGPLLPGGYCDIGEMTSAPNILLH